MNCAIGGKGKGSIVRSYHFEDGLYTSDSDPDDVEGHGVTTIVERRERGE